MRRWLRKLFRRKPKARSPAEKTQRYRTEEIQPHSETIESSKEVVLSTGPSGLFDNAEPRSPVKASVNIDCKTCMTALSPNQRVTFHDIASSANDGCAKCNMVLLLSERHIARKGLHRGAIVRSFFTDESWKIQIWTRYGAEVTLALTLEAYGRLGSPVSTPWGLLPQRRDISTNTGSKEALSKIQSWLAACQMHHDCRPIRDTPLPARVLVIESPQKIKLHITSGEVGSYVCLSHCWGSKLLIQSTKQNIKQFQVNIPWEAMPQTYRDVVDVVYRLGIRYLWIDSLCILQDDEDDWRHEGSKMSHIYKNAFLTIAATKARNSSAGLFTASAKHQADTLHHGMQEYRVREALPPHNFRNDDRRSPLLDRGWVMQERLLSPRVVHFASAELWWECMTTSDCECTGYGMQDWAQSQKRDLLPEINPYRAKWHWRLLVREYTTKALTYDKDILPAMQGLAKDIHAIFQSEYLAGLWKDSIIIDLLWFRRSVVDRPVNKCAPSWSWAAAGGSVKHIYDIKKREKSWLEHATLESSHMHPFGDDTFGQLVQGVICLNGWTSSATISYDRGFAFVCFDPPLKDRFPDRILSNDEFYFDRHDVDSVPSGAEVTVMAIATTNTQSHSTIRRKDVYCLVLKRKNEKDAIYERIGILSLSAVRWEQIYLLFKDPTETLTIA